MEEYDFEAVPSPEARRIITRRYFAGIAMYLLGCCAVLLSAGWTIAMLIDGAAILAWWTPLIGVPALLFVGGVIGWRLAQSRPREHAPTRSRSQTTGVLVVRQQSNTARVSEGRR